MQLHYINVIYSIITHTRDNKTKILYQGKN